MDKQTAQSKSEHYCAYQERSKQEVRNKLYEWAVASEDIDDIIFYLEEHRYLHEERFAESYSMGKFRMKNWGKIKIRQGLIMKGVSEIIIKEALNAIPVEDYRRKLKQIIRKKMEMNENLPQAQKNHNAAKYAFSQGYEPDLVWQLIEKLDF